MKFQNKEMLLKAFERIAIVREHIKHLSNILSFVQSRGRAYEAVQASELFQALCKIENQDWSDAMMWGLTLDDPERDRLKAAVHEHFLSKEKSVNFWIGNGEQVSKWLSVDEEDFREMARKAFAPKAIIVDSE